MNLPQKTIVRPSVKIEYSNSNFNELQLINGLQQKQKAAFEFLYNNYSRALYTIILNIIPDTAISSDVLHDVYIKIWQKIDQYDVSKGTLFTWMLNLAKHQAIDVVRSAGYRHGQKCFHIDATSTMQLQTNCFDYENIGLLKIVNKLDNPFRDVIVYSYFKGFTDKQIASLFNTPEGTIKTWKRKALIRLRKFLLE